MIDIARTLKFEGGFVHHPLDRGGPTKFGITMGALSPHLGRKATEEDIRKLTRRDAVKFYTAYAQRYGINKVSSRVVADQVFDCAVHHGPRRAVMWLQRAVGYEPLVAVRKLKIDGVLGSKTRAAVTRANVRKVNNQIVKYRAQFMARIVARRPDQSVFISGWIRRALSYMV